MGTDAEFKVLFPPGDDTYAWCNLYNGGTGSGKSFALKTRLRDMLNSKKPRKVLYFSPEWNEDKTLKDLRGEKYRDYVTGVDVSDNALTESELSPEQFFNTEIKARLDRAQPGCIAVFDDSADFCDGCQDLVRRLITKYMRVGRHRSVAIC